MIKFRRTERKIYKPIHVARAEGKFWISSSVFFVADHGVQSLVAAWGWDDALPLCLCPRILSGNVLELGRGGGDGSRVVIKARAETWFSWLGFAVGGHNFEKWHLTTWEE